MESNMPPLIDLLEQYADIQDRIIEKKITMSQPIKMICDNKDDIVKFLSIRCFQPENPKYYLIPYQPPNIGYLFDVKIDDKEVIDDLEYIGCIRTTHAYGGYMLFFRPDCNECLNQIPNSHFVEGETLYYTTLPAGTDVKDMYNSFTDRHHAYTLLFKKKDTDQLEVPNQ